MDEASRLDWYRDHAPPSRETSAAYRQRGQRLQKVMTGDVDLLRSRPLERVLAKRRHRLLPLGAWLSDLSTSGESTVALSSIHASLVHMHCNRIGLAPDQERILLGLLYRTRNALTFVRGA